MTDRPFKKVLIFRYRQTLHHNIYIIVIVIIIRLEEAEKKRQAMVTAQKEKQEARGMVVEHRVGLKILHRNETLKLLLRCHR